MYKRTGRKAPSLLTRRASTKRERAAKHESLVRIFSELLFGPERKPKGKGKRKRK